MYLELPTKIPLDIFKDPQTNLFTHSFEKSIMELFGTFLSNLFFQKLINGSFWNILQESFRNYSFYFIRNPLRFFFRISIEQFMVSSEVL